MGQSQRGWTFEQASRMSWFVPLSMLISQNQYDELHNKFLILTSENETVQMTNRRGKPSTPKVQNLNISFLSKKYINIKVAYVIA